MTAITSFARRKSLIAAVVPTANPTPPGVSGLCPIIADPITVVSLMVSIDKSLMTGAA